MTCKKFEDFQREIGRLRNENRGLREGRGEYEDESRMHTGLTQAEETL